MRAHGQSVTDFSDVVAASVSEQFDFGVLGGAFIDGSWQTDNLTVAVRDPESDRLLGWVAHSTPDDVGRAIAGVERTIDAANWPTWSRREALAAAARMVERQADRFAAIISSEGVKTITEAEREVARCVETLRLSSEAGVFLTGETLPFDDTRRGEGKVGWFVREPIGVVAAITSFNDPLNLVAHKVGPALMAGNGVVLKPSGSTPLTALALVEVLIAAGVPAGRIAVVCGGPETGHALVTDRRVNLVSFTGGPRAAERITEAAGPRKMLMELGGNNPTIVCAGADIASAAAAVVDGAFGVAGQNCLSVQRVYVHRLIFDSFLQDVVARTEALRVGSKADRSTDVGPMIAESEARRVEEWVAEALSTGATLRVGGRREGAFYHPTVLTDVAAGSRLLTEEVFGPVVTVMPFGDIEAAIRAANESDYALQAGLFTAAINEAFYIAAKLNAGAVVVNGTSDFRIDSMPFGGFKNSGIGREGVRYAVEAMTEPKCTIIATADRSLQPMG